MQIRPRKGQFVVFDKAAARLLRTIVLPVPGERTKGVVLTRTIFGNLLVGPTAEEQEDRDRATVEHATLAALIARAVEMVPGLADMPVTATYAGLRPATPDHLPIVGVLETSPNVMYATGHYRNGVLLAPLTAKVLADRLLSGSDDVSLAVTSPSRFGVPGRA